ncbi:MAG: Zinc-transporting ATPase [Candidatus Marinimicrobia bacterium]|nr:Zinc-transporting ATPase [Candidatus Neomarinimicrobiota bacterium]
MIRQSRMTDLISVQPALVLDGIERENGPVPEVSRRSLPREGNPNLPDNFREILHIASIAESVSEHPLARAIVEEAGKFSSIPEPETFQSYTGLGIEATYKSRQILVGSEAFMQKMNIAMGVAGTDVALETADIALMADELGKIPEALRISKRTLRNIRQNVIIALITVAALLTGVLMGSIHMAGGMLIHEASVMIVILNGMRLRWA